MITIRGRNVNNTWGIAKTVLTQHGVRCESRNGPVLEVPEPVTTEYIHTTERVLFDPVRDANPFFHLMEGLWMLAGRNDVAWITQFNKRFMSYSDDGTTFHAAYGYRWRQHFDMFGGGEHGFADQLKKAIAMLKADPTSRRVVVQMWDPINDLWSPEEVERRGSVPKDLPCNTAIYFKIRDGLLLMTVTNRSNDIVWGCYGANCVHMSMLHEYMAGMIGVGLGSYHQLSDSWHSYLDIWQKQDLTGAYMDPYGLRHVKPYPMVSKPEYWDDDLYTFMAGPHLAQESYENDFFERVALPMRSAWFAHKQKDLALAKKHLEIMPVDNDWRLAGYEWLGRREKGSNA